MQVGNERVHFGFVFECFVHAVNVRLSVGFAQFDFGADTRLGEGDVCRTLVQPWVGGHVGSRHRVTRVGKVFVMPIIRIFATNTRQIRTGAFAAPLEGAVIHAFFGDGVVTVAFRFPAEGADHLRVAAVAAFAHVDIETGKAQRFIGFDVAVFRMHLVVKEQRHDLHQAAPDDGKEGEKAEDDDAFFDAFVAHDVHVVFLPYAGWASRVVTGWVFAPKAVFQQL